MDFLSPGFNFEQLDELLQVCTFPCRQINDIEPHKLLPKTPSLQSLDPVTNQAAGDHCKKRKSSTIDIDVENPSECKKKELKHRDVERQRRKEMATLYRSLRSLLPLEYLKGKRSMSDHVHETVKYVRHLQKRVSELKDERDELRRNSDPSILNSVGSDQCKQSCGRVVVMVKACKLGMDVIVSTATVRGGGLPLSRVLNVLVGEGLTIFSCTSTRANKGRSIDPAELQQKLIEQIN